LLLFAHGARDPRWALPFEDIAKRIGAQAPQIAVRLAFLEFMTPGLVDGGAELAAMGCAAVDIVPLFLGAGGHVRKDLPGLVLELQGLHPQVQWHLRPAIGEVDAVVQAMAEAALAWTDAPAPTPTAA
jgi:sirohydrochlorin cobaltochelatase